MTDRDRLAARRAELEVEIAQANERELTWSDIRKAAQSALAALLDLPPDTKFVSGAEIRKRLHVLAGSRG